jgi:hypothetical protein
MDARPSEPVHDGPMRQTGLESRSVRTRRQFTSEEAERMLPLVRVIVRDLVGSHRTLSDRLEAYVRVMEARQRGTRLPDGFDPEAAEVEIESLEVAFNGTLEELRDLGLVCRDPHRGVVEFPAAPGRLTWTLGEDRVSTN